MSSKHGKLWLAFIQYSYSRLFLPMATDGRAVDGLIICINARKFPDFTI